MGTENLVCLGVVSNAILLNGNGNRSGLVFNVDPDLVEFPGGLNPYYIISGGKSLIGTLYIKLHDSHNSDFFSGFSEEEKEKTFHTYDITLDYNFE